jgi:hypothetical protein
VALESLPLDVVVEPEALVEPEVPCAVVESEVVDMVVDPEVVDVGVEPAVPGAVVESEVLDTVVEPEVVDVGVEPEVPGAVVEPEVVDTVVESGVLDVVGVLDGLVEVLLDETVVVDEDAIVALRLTALSFPALAEVVELPSQASSEATSMAAPLTTKHLKIFICCSPFIRRAQTHIVTASDEHIRAPLPCRLTSRSQ